ncbi:hypothetical protein PINS_up021531 [Pythium insidiosum]|nr:hypothetical protein PINS_up014673 [Pythium insidiosum]GLE09716.1 hypothetical protein PINS_up021531 [Pythium insidiosum]
MAVGVLAQLQAQINRLRTQRAGSLRIAGSRLRRPEAGLETLPQAGRSCRTGHRARPLLEYIVLLDRYPHERHDCVRQAIRDLDGAQSAQDQVFIPERATKNPI